MGGGLGPSVSDGRLASVFDGGGPRTSRACACRPVRRTGRRARAESSVKSCSATQGTAVPLPDAQAPPWALGGGGCRGGLGLSRAPAALALAVLDEGSRRGALAGTGPGGSR